MKCVRFIYFDASAYARFTQVKFLCKGLQAAKSFSSAFVGL